MEEETVNAEERRNARPTAFKKTLVGKCIYHCSLYHVFFLLEFIDLAKKKVCSLFLSGKVGYGNQKLQN